MESIILTEEQKKEDTERRVKEFQEGYKKLVEKYQIDFTAAILPQMRMVDLKNQKK